MATLANTYVIIDDFSNAASGGGPGGGMSGQPLMPPFIAQSVGDACRLGHIIATALQRPVRVGALGQFPVSYTLMTGVSPTLAITSVPSGISY